MNRIPPYFRLSPEVAAALAGGKPVVALESTVIAHGLPYPQNMESARRLGRIVRENGAVPAPVALMDGYVRVGLEESEWERLALPGGAVEKVSRRDVARVLFKRQTGATTVSATMWAARKTGIRVFATGGTGGVHREASRTFDISADLTELARTPVAVVASGVKSILDIPATLEYLETMGVPVLGYRTDDFPAFFSPRSGLKVPAVSDLDELAGIVRTHFDLDMETGILVANPVPSGKGMEPEAAERLIYEALEESVGRGVKGKDVTPFLLDFIHKHSGGRSLEANMALLENNARLAARLAVRLSEH
ncbi:MAG: pseudouridine-5'-phosphate glycosidase [Chlorobi bacterium]|nr:pseudouridine-5'-phosphate glycosidase [Chlorobiota bacterium]